MRIHGLLLLTVLSAPFVSAADAPGPSTKGTVTTGPESTPHQQKLALQQAVDERNARKIQLIEAVRDQQPEDRVNALRRAVAQAETAVLDLQFSALFQDMLAAVMANDPRGFFEPSDDAMRASISLENLAKVSTALHAAIPHGRYCIIPAGSLRRAEQDVLLYVIRPIESDGDLLAEMSVKDGRCSGFVIH